MTTATEVLEAFARCQKLTLQGIRVAVSEAKYIKGSEGELTNKDVLICLLAVRGWEAAGLEHDEVEETDEELAQFMVDTEPDSTFESLHERFTQGAEEQEEEARKTEPYKSRSEWLPALQHKLHGVRAGKIDTVCVGINVGKYIDEDTLS